MACPLFRGKITTSFNQPIGGWNTSNVTNMSGMFSSATSFNQPIGNWNTGKVTDLSFMFAGTAAFDQPIGSWNTAHSTRMDGMFSSATTFNQPLDGWNTANVVSMDSMFSGASVFNQTIGKWNVGKVQDAGNMFYQVALTATNYDELLVGWEAQTLQRGVRFTAGNSKYLSSKAQAARNNIINKYSWIIEDGGFALPTPSPTPTIRISNLDKVILAYPNPGHGTIHFVWAESVPGKMKINIYNFYGERIAVIGSENNATKCDWNSSGIAPGIYLYNTTLTVNDGTECHTPVQKLAITK